MFMGFNLSLDENAYIFRSTDDYRRYVEDGKTHLESQKAKYKTDLKKYVNKTELDGTKIQDEWFPQIEADVFISHSGLDEELACALAGWLHKNFELDCFIDSNVWGYSRDLLNKMNDRLSDKRLHDDGDILYSYESCNKVSEHVNAMLSIALQKMIDKVEAIVLLNTENSVQVHNDSKMNETYSPWIYSEIICTQLVRKKPLLLYRNYTSKFIQYKYMYESVQETIQFLVSYTVSLKHLTALTEDDLAKWKDKCNINHYDYKLDALYEYKCPDEMDSTRKMFNTIGKSGVKRLKDAYSTSERDVESEATNLRWIMEESEPYYCDCNRCRCIWKERMND